MGDVVAVEERLAVQRLSTTPPSRRRRHQALELVGELVAGQELVEELLALSPAHDGSAQELVGDLVAEVQSTHSQPPRDQRRKS